MFVIQAFLGGWTNVYSYLVDVHQTAQQSLWSAFDEHVRRGGRYGVAVYRRCGPGAMSLYHYFPSDRAEPHPEVNDRLIDVVRAAGGAAQILEARSPRVADTRSA